MKPSELSPTFVRNLKAIRRARNMSQQDLANEIGSYPNVISELENGKTSPTLKMIERLAAGLRVDSDILLTDDAAANFLSATA